MPHSCDWTYKDSPKLPPYWADAIVRCTEDAQGRLLVDNGESEEYGNQVNFCPFCGYKAPEQVGTPQSLQEKCL